MATAMPIVSRVKKLENVIVAAGHAMLGMSLGPITGKLVSQLARGEASQLGLTPLSAERF